MSLSSRVLVFAGVSLSLLVSFAVFSYTGLALAQSATTASSTPAATPVAANSPYTIETLTDDGRVFNDFVLGPGKIELDLKPGETKTVELTVSNRMGQAEEFEFQIEDAAGGKASDKPVILLGNDRGPYTLRDYIHIPALRFELQNMERARIPVTVTLPADAEPGGRYGSVLVSVVSQKANVGDPNSTSPASAIVSRIGTLFFVTTPGTVETEGELTAFDTIPHRKFFFSGPVNFGLLFENKGAIHLNPYGDVSITNMFGEEVGFVELDPWFVLPQSERTREVTWNREFLVGRYVATAHINRGYNDMIDERALVFWVIPWKLVAVTFGTITILYLLVKLFFSRFEFKRRV